MEDRNSHLLIDEYFATGDDRFLQGLRSYRVPGRLALLADRWKKDPRPWARKQIFDYLALPMNCPAHETVVKRLFKFAEEKADSELMAAFAVAFDRLVRRVRTKKFRYDYRTRQSWYEEFLKLRSNSIPTPSPGAKDGAVKPSFEAFKTLPFQDMSRRLLFSQHTRAYLRRRTWRYFRRLGFAGSRDYVPAAAAMLRRYRDHDVAKGENLLDNWCLLHACFGESTSIAFGAAHAKVVGQGLSQLQPAPSFPELWKEPSAASVLLDLLLRASSRLVRVWATQLLRSNHVSRLSNMSVTEIRRLLDHDDSEVQLLGAELLENNSTLDKLTVAQWIELLGTKNVTILETIAQLMRRHVRADRIDLAQTVSLAIALPAPVAKLGRAFLADRQPSSDFDRETIAALSSARCALVGRELAAWAMARLGTATAYDVDRVARFFDSLLREVRLGAWDWLTPGSRGWDDSALWSRLIETPYDDVRLQLVEALARRQKAPGLGAKDLSAVWSAVLLGIHRGGRHKLTALRQISDVLRENPESAVELLPVLSVAIRSVRAPEARAGLAAIVSVVEARPHLADLVAKHLPELQLNPAEATP